MRERLKGYENERTLAAILGWNLVPVAGVVALGWSPAILVALYWLEIGIAGLIALPTILLANGPDGRRRWDDIPLWHDGPAIRGMSLFELGVFIFSFAGIWLLMGAVFLEGSIGVHPWELLGSIESTALVFSIFGMAVPHGTSFVSEYIADGGYERAHPMLELLRSYKRLFLVYVLLVLASGLSGGGALVVLTAGKLGTDLLGYRLGRPDQTVIRIDPRDVDEGEFHASDRVDWKKWGVDNLDELLGCSPLLQTQPAVGRQALRVLPFFFVFLVMATLVLGAFLAAGLSAIGANAWLINGVLVGLFVAPFLWVIGLFLLRYKYVEYIVYDEGVLTYDSRLGRVRRAVQINDVTGLNTSSGLTGWY